MKRMKRITVVTGVFLAINLWFAWFAPSTWALGSSQYKLTSNSSYIEGCYDPCMCPIWMNNSLQGSFMLTAVDQAGDVEVFEVGAIDWHFVREDETIAVTGSGYYWIDGDQHQLVLDLLVGDAAVDIYDSGLVARVSEFPGIIIAVAENGFFCYDHVFDLKAVPEPVGLSVSSWGSLKSIYR